MPVQSMKRTILQRLLDAFAAIVEDKLANVATKECILKVKQTILDQQLEIEELEAKVVVMEKYIEGIEKVQQRVCEVGGLSDGIADLECVCDDNEQHHQRLCLRLNGVAVEDDAAVSVRDYLEMIKKCSKKILD